MSNILIVEDDLEISAKFRTNQAVIVEQLCQQDWDFVYFGHPGKAKENSPVALVRFSERVMTAHFYAANCRIFVSLLRFLEELQHLRDIPTAARCTSTQLILLSEFKIPMLSP
ncbi:hypothetical protein [Microcoleus sp. herbarium2]|uniref:hypothetical protein n=1 Tax=Microcoleus sp. herbarium2 TaxID=3055433 RepID=UPI002FD690CB